MQSITFMKPQKLNSRVCKIFSLQNPNKWVGFKPGP